MNLFQVLSIFVVGTTLVQAKNVEIKTFFDFTTLQNVDNWMESSDTVRSVGKSKATLTLALGQKTEAFQRAVFSTFLVPLPNGAAFAGVRTETKLNLASFKNIEITCRGQGENKNYKIVLRHNNLHSNEDITYEQFFTVSMSTTKFSTVSMPLANFKPFYHGLEQSAIPLNTANISMFGLQMYGGVYKSIKQTGSSVLEIKNIVATA